MVAGRSIGKFKGPTYMANNIPKDKTLSTNSGDTGHPVADVTTEGRLNEDDQGGDDGEVPLAEASFGSARRILGRVCITQEANVQLSSKLSKRQIRLLAFEIIKAPYRDRQIIATQPLWE